jgi:hypothetical protein
MFTINDVDNYKKGLSEKQKKQWVRLSNSIIKRELEKGTKEEEATAMAVKQANTVVNVNAADQYSVYKNKQKLNYEIKITTHEGKANLVVPVVMMVEGVHSGSQGAIYHSIEELGKFPESWNGIPVVIYHPKNDDGDYVGANSPEVIEKYQVGRVYNTEVEGKKLKAEVWFDEEKLNAISETTLLAVNETREIEVSLGMFTENEEKEGTWHGEKYTAIAHNHRPDHLAILPDQVGACSCKDGCGLGANEIKVYADYTTRQLSLNEKPGYQKLISMAYDALRMKDEHTYHFLEDIYDDYVIYTWSKNSENKMYKQAYKIESGKIEFVGAPVEVHRKVEYIVNTSLTRNKFNNNQKKEDKNMSKNECPKCLEKVNALIANEKSPYKEADREWLLSLNEDQLTKLSTPEVKEVVKEVEKKVEVNKLTPEQEADLAFVANQRKERKGKMVKAILDNTKDVWDEVSLNAMSEEVLEKVFKSVEKKETADFSLNGDVRTLNNNSNSNSGSGGRLYLPGVEVK